MLSLILISLLSLPIYPLNPSVQDTLNPTNIHVTVGLNGPNSLLTAGPEFTLKYEWMVSHPIVVRASLDYKYSTINSNFFPQGKMHSFVTSLETFTYRGTDKMTGYLGIGIVYSMNNFHPSQNSSDSLLNNHNISKVEIKNKLGYRLILGMRIKRSYSVEIGITEIKTDFIYTTVLDNSSYFETLQKARISDFRFTLGYLIPFKIF
ncbi:MAG: hypothetical protein U9N54_00225 [candidate division Zixibacteria bacterium]|nr:hypothetical protein [candidate division Zixibacteria bacterium]